MHEEMSVSVTDVPVGDGYADYSEYLGDELRLLALRLRKELLLRRASAGGERETKQLFISETEVLSLLESLLGPGTIHPDAAAEPIDALIAGLKETKEERLKKTKEKDSFPLLRLARIFGLMPFEIDLLIMALAVDLSPQYERIYGYLNDDLTKKAPALCLVRAGMPDKEKSTVERLSLFGPQSPLLYFELIRFIDANEGGSFLNRRFVLDERIRRFLVGDQALPEILRERAKIYYPGDSSPECTSLNVTKDAILRLLRRERPGHGSKPVFWLYGKAREEKRLAILAICEELNMPLLAFDVEDILLEAEQKSTIRSLFREAALQSAAVFLSGGERLHDNDERSHHLVRILLRTLEALSWLTFISAEALWVPEDTIGRCVWYPVEFQAPTYDDRRKIWKNALQGSEMSESDVALLSARYCFGEGQIRRVASHAKHVSKGKGLSLDDVSRACAVQSRQRLSVYAAKVIPHYRWGDIVLPEDKLRQLREIFSFVRHRHVVHFQWGFEKKLALGRGLNILFSGPSGTGKTMAADIIANDLEMEMYKIDLSTVVSKYIGETEKNLSRIFRETSSGNAILFFDEADALFGKRSEVKDAHDRYANIEINYLLQKMEEHEGIVILATNLSKNLDDAFLRRMHFAIEFPFPDEKQRELIWRKIFPLNAPLSEDIDYAFLSGKFRLSGANIKNIGLNAAFYAAEESSDITMRHIILGVKRELQKIGKLCVKGDFGRYYELLEDGGRV
jgi:DNA polymerase III delta prime subunit